jgi:hypothetical protein
MLESLRIYLAPLIGLATLGIGLLAVTRPQKMSINYGVSANNEALPYVVATGIRDVFMGLIILALFFLNEWRGIAIAQFLLAIVAIVDFAIVIKFGEKLKALIHLTGALAVSFYGIWILFSLPTS